MHKRLSEYTVADVANYLKLEQGEYSDDEIIACMDVAKAYISSQTGIPVEGYSETLDSHPDFYYPFMIVCREVYDTRTAYPGSDFAGSTNKIVDSILSAHRRNLVR